MLKSLYNCFTTWYRQKFGIKHFAHISDGYKYMMSLGYDEMAKICLTHSFNKKTTDEYIGNFDTSE